MASERGTAFGIWGAAIAASAAVGPLLGGALTDTFGWSSIFYINVPVGVVVILLAIARLPESRDPEGKRVDWIGTVTFTAALFAPRAGADQRQRRGVDERPDRGPC